MASIRTIHRSSARFTLALSGAAVAVVTLASGAPSAAAAVAPSGAAGVSQSGSAPAGGVLDGTAQPMAASTKHHHHPPRKHHHHGPYTPRQLAWHMLDKMHWSSGYQYPYLNRLWEHESGSVRSAVNPYSGAAGIPQATPGSKMATAGPDWPNNASTQIRWGLRYIKGRYGSPRRAWLHEMATGWY
ncbi:MAG: lytic transglycosylase domain-containing protein [Actinomycetota bacterium]